MNYSVHNVAALIDQIISQGEKNNAIVAMHNDMVMENDSIAPYPSQIGNWNAEVADHYFGTASQLLAAIVDKTVNPTDAYYYVDGSATLRTFNGLLDSQSPIDTHKLAMWLLEDEEFTDYVSALDLTELTKNHLTKFTQEV